MTVPTSPNSPVTAASCCTRSGTLKIVALVLISALAGAAVSRAAQHWGGHHGIGYGFMSGPMDAAQVDRRIDKMTSHLGKEVEATTEQRDKIAVIVKAAAKDLIPMRETMRDAHKQLRVLLTQPSVDRAAIETLRASQITNVDAMSKRMSATLTDAADVLTPEQRKKLSDRFAMHEGWRHGDDPN